MRLITDFLDSAAENFPNKTAVADADKAVTYSELQETSRRIASFIISANLFKQPVALIMNKSVDMLTAFFAVAYSGNFYAALNPKQSKEKIIELISHLKTTMVITTGEWIELVEESVDKEVKIMTFEEMLETELDIKAITDIQRKLIDADPLYLVLTSGSTGKPKGVVVTHQNTVYLCRKHSETFNIKSTTVMAYHFSMYFVATIYIYSVMIEGGTCLLDMSRLLLNPTAWNQMIKNYQVNYINGTPSAFELMSRTLSDDDCYKTVRLIFLAGEDFTVRGLHQWDKYFPNAHIYSCYGMSELGGYSLLINISDWMEQKERKENQYIPLGRPVENTDAFVVGEDGKEADRGVKGELYIRFSALSDGYYDEFEKTNALLVQNPLEKRFRDICVKTGDLTYVDEEGYFHHAGRIDFMVKRHGIRIELGEIETRVCDAGAKTSVCVFLPESERIVAYYVGEAKEKDVFAYLYKHLSPQAMPDRIYKIENIPLNQNGKYDREELKKRASRMLGG